MLMNPGSDRPQGLWDPDKKPKFIDTTYFWTLLLPLLGLIGASIALVYFFGSLSETAASVGGEVGEGLSPAIGRSGYRRRARDPGKFRDALVCPGRHGETAGAQRRN